MKKSGQLAIIYVLITILVGSFVFGAVISPEFYVKPKAVSSIIHNPVTDYADFKIVIENNGAEDDEFNLLFLEDPKWSYQVLPSPINRKILIPANDTGEIHILVKGNVDPGNYAVKVSVQSEKTKNVIDNVMRITVLAPVQKIVVPDADVSVETTVPTQMDPKGAYNVLVTVNNNNERKLDNVLVKLNSNILSEETLVDILPNESKTISFAVILIDNIKPQKDNMNISLYQRFNFSFFFTNSLIEESNL